ncbi:hypothetical protein QZH41_007002 [Actinostola sp. cb2023]|nr:hypothetical protein QZH41_007002 [Actinostola sp. cb2023]
MTVNKEVPSFLKVMGSEVKVYYRGQRQTCRKCGSASHFAKDCPNTQCFRCHGLGHVSRECTMVERCERCGEEGHTSWSCKAAFKFTAPSKVVDSQSTAEAHQGRQQSQLSSPLGFVFAPPSQIWSTAEVETPIKGTSSCTEDAESGTGATQELYTPQSSTNTVESKGPAEIVEEMIKVMKHPPKDDTETDNMLSGGSDSESAIGEGDGQDNMSSVESDIESDMEAVSGTAKRPASPVTSPRAKLKRDMEEIESVVKQRLHGIPNNAYLNDPYKLRLPGIDRLCQFILQHGRGCLIYKKDLRRAYRQLPIDPKDYNLLGFVFNGAYYFDLRCPFGLRSSAMICQRTTSAVIHILKKIGFTADVYLDDFYGAEESTRSTEAFNTLQSLFDPLGLQSSPEKDCFPSTNMRLYMTLNFELHIFQACTIHLQTR